MRRLDDDRGPPRTTGAAMSNQVHFGEPVPTTSRCGLSDTTMHSKTQASAGEAESALGQPRVGGRRGFVAAGGTKSSEGVIAPRKQSELRPRQRGRTGRRTTHSTPWRTSQDRRGRLETLITAIRWRFVSVLRHGPGSGSLEQVPNSFWTTWFVRDEGRRCSACGAALLEGLWHVRLLRQRPHSRRVACL